MEGFPLTVDIRVHWSELDALGHVNNARYFTWFETARIECFREVGLPIDGTPEVGPILARTACDFLAPVYYPAQITIGARVSRLGTTSFGMEYQAALAEAPARAVARGDGVVVLVDYRSGETTPIPDELREKLTRLS